MLVNLAVPNLISGISQQPPPLRLSSSLEDSQNQWASVVSGLTPRFPTEHIADLGFTATNGAVACLIDRDDSYRYIVCIADGDLKVFNMSGTEQTVNFPNGKSYLQAGVNGPTNNFRFLTFEDTTFILNRTVVTSEHFIGEEGTATFTPDGTADTVYDLPTASVTYVDQVYQADDSGYYYRCELQSGLPQIIGWEYQSSTTSSEFFTGDGYSLPADPVIDQIYNLITGTDEYGMQYIDVYVGVETQAATSDYYEWRYRSLSQLTTVTNGRLDPQDRASVCVTNSVSNSNYSVYINGVLKATFLTGNGIDASHALEGTDVIATELYNDLVSNGYTCERIGSTIAISGLVPTDEVVITTTNGDKAMRVYRDVINSFSDLPPNEVEGRIVKVRGAPEDNQDDYYVIFTDEKRWQETYGYNELSEMAPNNMPHVLVREADGTWTFKHHTWAKRAAGDTDSNPMPSFTGYKLQDIFQFTNRIGFVTEDNIIMSEANKFENYFRTTIATLLDSDPIDVAIISPLNDAIRHAIPFNKDLLILGDLSQHRLSYQNLVGPKNIQVAFTTSYNCSRDVEPINMGNSIYFVDDRNTYENAKMFEYFVKPNTTADDAQEITDPVPTLLPRTIRILEGSPRLNLSVTGSSLEPDTLYVYKYFWSGDKKIQNSWGRWVFADADNIFWSGFSGEHMYMLIERGDTIFLERMRITENVADRVILDRSVAASALSLSYASGYTQFTLPYTSPTTPECVSVDDDGVKTVHIVEHVSGDTYKVAYDLTGEAAVYVGIPIDSYMIFSPPYLRVQKGGGEMVSEEVRLAVRDITVSYANLDRMDAQLTIRGKEYNKTVANVHPVPTGKIKLSIPSNNHDFTLKLYSAWPLSYQLTSAEWRGEFNPKSRRT